MHRIYQLFVPKKQAMILLKIDWLLWIFKDRQEFSFEKFINQKNIWHVFPTDISISQCVLVFLFLKYSFKCLDPCSEYLLFLLYFHYLNSNLGAPSSLHLLQRFNHHAAHETLVLQVSKLVLQKTSLSMENAPIRFVKESVTKEGTEAKHI